MTTGVLEVSSERDVASVLGCSVDRLNMAQTVRRCAELVEAGGTAQHVAINAAKLVMLQDDGRLRDIVAGCALVSADGQSVVWASRLLRDPLPSRVAGIDLMHELLALAERKGYPVFILGARQEVLARALERLGKLHPHLVVAGARHGYFTDADDDAVCAEIRASGAKILFVAMSSPRKEYWLAKHGASLGVPFVMGVGGSIDVVAGITRRAPRWMQATGLEWLYRFAQEPRRLARRYAVTNARFAMLLARELVRQSRGRAVLT